MSQCSVHCSRPCFSYPDLITVVIRRRSASDDERGGGGRGAPCWRSAQRPKTAQNTRHSSGSKQRAWRGPGYNKGGLSAGLF